MLREKFNSVAAEMEQNFIALNDKVSRENCQKVSKSILEEIEIDQQLMKSKDFVPGFAIQLFEKLRSSYMESVSDFDY